MVVNERVVSDIRGKDIFTDKGLYCGKTEDVILDLTKFRVHAVVINVAKGSYLSEVVGGKRGVIVPYPLIKAVNDIIIIKHISAPMAETTQE